MEKSESISSSGLENAEICIEMAAYGTHGMKF